MKINETVRYVFWFILFVLVQGLILNHVNIGGYLNPYLYIMFILLLPFDISRSLSLIIAFLLGYSVDLFAGTPGMHAFASVFAAFVRPFLISSLSKRDDEDTETRPTIRSMGVRWILYYSSILVLIHHSVYFYIESFRITEFFQTLSRSLISSLLTIVMILLVQFLFFSSVGSKKKFSS